MISIARAHSRNVKHWQNGTMALRWCAAGMAEASKQFRRVKGKCTSPPYAVPSTSMLRRKLSVPCVKMIA